MICVIGGSGFIGTRLCSRLQSSDVPFLILDVADSAEFRDVVKRIDVRDAAALTEALPGGATIVNLAAEHRDDVRPKRLYDEVNVQGARNVCDAARARGISKIIFTSSVAVYGFADPGTDESGSINYFNDYGRTKWLAEQVYRDWHAEDPESRTLVIIRPTVVFGEGNRGNVYNLLRHVASKRFVMVGSGQNRKSMAYVENVAAFLEYALELKSGLHVFNYIDKPDYSMNELVREVRSILGEEQATNLRIPYWIGMTVGGVCDVVSAVTRKSLTVSSVRIKKFCSDTVFDTRAFDGGFVPPVTMTEALRRTVAFEFGRPGGVGSQEPES